MTQLRIVPMVGLAIALVASAVAAQATQETVDPEESGAYTPHPEAEEAIGKLKSPFCPGLMLEVCPSPQAAELRDSIQELAEGGMDSDSIVEWMLAEHGEEWRAVPQARGTGILAWVMPPLALVVGLIVVGLVLRKFRSPRTAADGADSRKEISTDEEARLNEALREMEEAESEDALL